MAPGPRSGKGERDVHPRPLEPDGDRHVPRGAGNEGDEPDAGPPRAHRWAQGLTPSPHLRFMDEVVTGLHSLSIHITDIQKARTFFRDVLGLKELTFDEKGSRAVFAIPGSSAPLTMHIMGPTEEGRPAGTVSGITFRNSDPRAACAEIKRRGGTITVEPNDIEFPGGKFTRAVFADPDGNEFVISNRPG